ncbi:MAG: helix-turn-helix domain-containing protein [Sedimenticola sp.]
MNIEKLAYSIKAAAEATSYSRSYIYELIKIGRLKTYQRGGRRFITADELKRLIEEDAINGSQS